jgi:hypothetical protein
MAYAECETALATLLKTLNGNDQFKTAAQVSQKDYAILDKGIPTAAVLVPDSFGITGSKGPVYDRTWDILIDLFVRYTTEAATMATFATLRDSVIRLIDQNPNLSRTAGVYDTVVSSDGGIVDVNKSDGTGPVFRSQRLRVTVYQSLTV